MALAPLLRLFLPALALMALAVFAPFAGGVTPVPGCASFGSQAAAQTYFVALRGGPGKRVGGLHADRDGIACEGRPGPYKGFATIGFNKRKSFLYGIASMPPAPAGDGFACLYGNPHFDDGPRLLTVYRAQPGADLAITDSIAVEARPTSGRLLWKADKKTFVRGRYYALFAERVPLSPYGPNECPGFRSAEVPLP